MRHYTLRISFSILVFGWVMGAARGLAETPTKDPVSGGVWESTDTSKAPPAVREVNIDSSDRGVVVVLNHAGQKTVPQSIGITFFGHDGNKTTLELKAMDPKIDPSRKEPRFAGKLTPESQSFVGFEIRIPFGKKSKRIVRSEDLKRK